MKTKNHCCKVTGKQQKCLKANENSVSQRKPTTSGSKH